LTANQTATQKAASYSPITCLIIDEIITPVNIKMCLACIKEHNVKNYGRLFMETQLNSYHISDYAYLMKMTHKNL
jgi:hypothetical protein